MIRKSAASTTPLSGVDVLLCDLDGVIYQGPSAIPYAVDSLVHAPAQLAYLTNNASRTPAQVAGQLAGFGLPAEASDVVTSPQAAVKLLRTLIPAGSLVLVVGGEGLTSELELAGFQVTRKADDRPRAVVQGFAPSVGWEQLAEASFAIQRDDSVVWLGTNTDWTIPVAGGIAPGNGALVSAVHLAVGKLATFAGKPETPMFEVAKERFGANLRYLMIGDRLDTDIMGANRAGIPSALVLTGIDRAKQVLAADEVSRPTYILEDLRQLHEPYPEIERATEGDVQVVRVGKAVVKRKGHVVRVAKNGRPIDTLRAGAAAIYDSGLKIFGLDVDPALYSTL